MAKPIFTNNGIIDTNMEMVQAVIGEMEENLQHLVGLKNGLLQAFQGQGSTGYEGTAQELERRLEAYRTSINQLKGATSGAARMITDADANVSRLFAGIV